MLMCYAQWAVDPAIQMKNQPSRRCQNKFIIDLWITTLFTLNSSLNCLIFFYKNSVLRRQGGIFLKKCLSRTL